MNKIHKVVLSIWLFNSILFATSLKEEIINNEITKTNTQLEQKKEIEIILRDELKKYNKTLLISKKTLRNYYKTNDYKPFWFNESGLKNIALDLLEKIKIDPVLKSKATNSFRLEKVISQLKSLDNSVKQYDNNMIKIDFMFTEIYDKYMTYLSSGIINWKKFKRELYRLKRKEIIADWEKFNLKVNKINLLKESIEQNDLNIAINSVDFTYPNAKKLIKEIEKLEIVLKNGDYTKVPQIKKSLRLGDNKEVIEILRKRLLQSGDLINNCQNNIILNKDEESTLNPNKINKDSFEPIDCKKVFDKDLKNAVISFQKSHGLLADGIVGSQTIKYLNISAQEKIKKIILNLERMRWLPRDLGNNFLLVNIPDFRLKMYDKGKVTLNMPVVVGKKRHPTPIFSNSISYIVLNPYWKIPKRIARKELIPKLIENPNYLNERGIKILENWNPNSYEYNSEDINWNEYHSYLNYLENIKNNRVYEPMEFSSETLMLEGLRFVQTPSKSNPLGKIKFMFPNKYSVYMHDTNAKSLFKKTKRAFSHGCIRLSQPKELLKKISQSDQNIKLDKVQNILEDIEKKDLSLRKKIPVHIVYLTSWVDENNKLQFREDIYKYDKIQKNLIF